jgi:hypothetical protein
MFESSTLGKQRALEDKLVEKRRTFELMLLSGHVRMWIDRLHEELVIPDALRLMAKGPLAYTPELQPIVTKEGIAARMWFGGAVFETFVPWAAIYFMYSPRGHYSWLEDAPPSVIDETDGLFAELDAEFYGERDSVTLDVAAMVPPARTTGTSMPPEAAADAVSDAAQGVRPSDARDIRQPKPGDTPPSSVAPVPRAPSPSLLVIVGGGTEDSRD